MAVTKTKLTRTKKEKSPVSEVKTETSLQDKDFQQMISEAAYYRAEKRDFASGYEMEDWAEAEAEAEILELQKESLVA